MLDAMRKNAQSWGIKLVFGLIILVFVFWGVGSFQGERSAVLATVGGVNIMIDDFQRAYNRQVDQIRQENPDLTTEDLKRMNIKQQVLNEMVLSQLLLNEAQRLGIVVAPEELRTEIRRVPAFQNEQKRFDPGLYQAILRANNLTPGQFEAQVLHDLLLQKMEKLVRMPVRVGEEEARDFFYISRERRSIDYIFYDWKDFQDAVEPAEEQIQSYYDENQDRFAVPPKMRMEYLLFTPETLSGQYNATEEEIEDHYQANTERFSHEEQVKARHIIIQLDQNAPEETVETARERLVEARDSIIQGAEFAELAREISDGPSAPQGGDLGWFGRGAMVETFEEAAFGMEPGQISEPVRTQFGWHLIKVEDRRPAGVKPLEEVRETIADRIRREKASTRMNDRLDQALELLLTGSGFEEAAASVGLAARETEPFPRTSGPEGLDLDRSQLEMLFSLPEGGMTESPILLDEGYLLARKTEQIPAAVQPLEEVRARIVASLEKTGGMDLARNQAEQALTSLQGEEPAPEDLLDGVQTSEPFGRGSTIPELGMNPDLVQDAFAVRESEWFPRVYELPQGHAIARLNEVVPPEKEQWTLQKYLVMDDLEETKQSQLFQAYVTELRNRSEIEIRNPAVLRD